MKRKSFKFILLMFTFTLVALNAGKYGLLTLIPPLMAIVLAFITKNVIISLFLGVLSGTFMLALNENSILPAIYVAFEKFTYAALGALADPWNAGIVLQVLTIGGLIALISKLGGAKAVAETLAKHAKTAKSSQLIAWVLGLFIFFDDYANSLIVGPIMRPVTDKQHVSREKLSFIIDATAAPVAGIMFVSTWIGYELSVIKDGFGQIGQTVSPFNIFIETIPFRFYNILMLLFVALIALLLRDFGPMYKAERRARLTGKVLKDGAVPLSGAELDELTPKSNVKLSVWNAIIPIGSLIVSALLLFYFNGRASLLGGEDAEMIALMQNAPASFVAIREAFGASDAAVVLFQAALIASIITI
ncbi:MAG: Na+/H+ antiporter NhaC-like protein, partial [Clostridia bacterium]|nr:Na+/H+ antiporter NhaC-like protein [Clostridia bacterium]